MALNGSTPRASSSIPAFDIASRSIFTRLCVESMPSDAVGLGAVLISICPPGSNEMYAPSASFQDGGSFAVRLFMPAFASSQCSDSTSAVDARASLVASARVRVVL